MLRCTPTFEENQALLHFFFLGSLAAFGGILYIPMIRSASSKLVDPDEQGMKMYDKC